MPKVSIILTSYNHEKYIADAIESALNQTFTDFELLICDDGSTDNSHEIIKSFHDERIKLFLYKKNRGVYFAMQEAFVSLKGKYFALHHSDDVWESTKLEKQVNFMDANPEYEVCFTQAKFIDERGEIYDLPEGHAYKNVFKQKNRPREEWLQQLFWNGNCFCNPSFLMKNAQKNFLRNYCLFQLPDYFMWVNFCLKKNPYVLPEELIKFRIRRGEQNSVSSWSTDKLIRVSNEFYFLARAFLPLIKNEKFFLKVFPEAEKFLINGKINTSFAFAQMCLKRNLPAFQKLALEILYDLLHNDSGRSSIKKLYNYNENNFIQDTTKFDVFGTKLQLPILNSRVFFDLGENFTGNEVAFCQTLIKADGSFLATFDFHSDKKIFRVRFDPDEKPLLSIKIIKFIVNGEKVENFTSNAVTVDEGYFNFLTDDPIFVVDKEISAGNIHIEISGESRNFDAMKFFTEFENESENKTRQLENSLAESENKSRQLENSLAESENKSRQLENSLAVSENKTRQLENSLAESENKSRQLENSLAESENKSRQLENSLAESENKARQLENSLAESENKSRQLENSLAVSESKNRQLENTVFECENKIQNLKNIQNEILNSNSWKITKPLRAVGKIFNKK